MSNIMPPRYYHVSMATVAHVKRADFRSVVCSLSLKHLWAVSLAVDTYSCNILKQLNDVVLRKDY